MRMMFCPFSKGLGNRLFAAVQVPDFLPPGPGEMRKALGGAIRKARSLQLLGIYALKHVPRG